MIGYEGKGSIKSYLKNKRWVTGVEAGIFHSTSEMTLYLIKFDLTEQGYDHVTEILEVVFAFTQLIEQEGITKEQYKQLEMLTKLEFKYL